MSAPFSLTVGRSGAIDAATKEDLLTAIRAEELFWQPLAEKLLIDSSVNDLFRSCNAQITELTNGYRNLVAEIESSKNINTVKIAKTYHNSILTFPPSESLEGGALYAASESGQNDSVFQLLAAHLAEIGMNVSSHYKESLKSGNCLLASIRLQGALDRRKTDGRKVAGFFRRMESAVDRAEKIALKIEEGAENQAAHIANWNEKFDEMAGVIKQKVVEKLNKIHNVSSRERAELLAENRQFSEKRSEQVALEVAKLSDLREKLMEDFHDLHALYHKHLQFQRPSVLWGKRAEEHKANARFALKFFWMLVLGIIGAVVALFFLGFGEYVANSFAIKRCDGIIGVFCQNQFSYKGPLLVASILLITSLFLWLVRLQYRIYLSERHLSQSASERRAFAETYLAMRGDSTVGRDNEAIVLGALFRPSQDGIVKDDETGFDVSAASVIARHLGGGKP